MIFKIEGIPVAELGYNPEIYSEHSLTTLFLHNLSTSKFMYFCFRLQLCSRKSFHGLFFKLAFNLVGLDKFIKLQFLEIDSEHSLE